MATRFLARSLITTKPPLSSALSHTCGAAATSSAVLPNSSSFLFRLRPIVAAASTSYFRRLLPAISTRAFSTRQTASSLNDPNPNWSNRPPKETILLDGCDFEHWLVVVEKPEGDPTRDEIIDSYIKTLAMVIGSEEEARMKIYSVSTRHYYAFGALVSEELSYKLKELPKVRWVLPDSYLDVKNKDYGGEPFINGQAVPYDPKYHEEWVRNNARANERNRRNDRPRNFDRSRNFERRREVQGQNSGGNPGGPGGNYNGGPPLANPGPNMGGQPNYGGGGVPPNNAGNYQRPPLNNPSNFQQGPGPNSGGSPYQPGPGPNHGGFPAGGPGPNPGGFPAGGPGPNPGGFPAGGPGPNPGGFPAGQNQNPYANAGGGSPYQNQNYPGPGNFGPNPGYSPGPTQNNFAPNPGSGPGQYQNAHGQNAGNPSQGQNIPGRDFPPSSNY